MSIYRVFSPIAVEGLHESYGRQTTWAMEAYDDLMIRRWPASAVVPSTLVLFAHGAAYLLLGLILFRQRLARVS